MPDIEMFIEEVVIMRHQHRPSMIYNYNKSQGKVQRGTSASTSVSSAA